ncbi:hypothetical protein ACFPU1_00645 [Thalassorhabdus alkalitolerans]|uniref:Uncharacterized protein n=1 Tax=Thalassorhabdus alkalitolerans TaxID=2282697 RepID=A0ABW0YFS3_9BACI
MIGKCMGRGVPRWLDISGMLISTLIGDFDFHSNWNSQRDQTGKQEPKRGLLLESARLVTLLLNMFFHVMKYVVQIGKAFETGLSFSFL